MRSRCCLSSVPGLLVLIDAARTPAVAARRGWWFGLGHHVLGLYWVTEAILFEAARFWWLVPLAVPALAAALAVFIAAACGVARLARPGWPRVLALGGAWVLADLARQFVLTGFPWNPWGSVWEILAHRRCVHPAGRLDRRARPHPGHAAARGNPGARLAVAHRRRCWLAAWLAVGLIRLNATLPPPPTALNVVLVQGNVAQGQKWDQALPCGFSRATWR